MVGIIIHFGETKRNQHLMKVDVQKYEYKERVLNFYYKSDDIDPFYCQKYKSQKRANQVFLEIVKAEEMQNAQNQIVVENESGKLLRFYPGAEKYALYNLPKK